MSELKQGIGETDEWYTPPFIFDALDLEFDLDPCSPGQHHWVPARKVYTKEDDGLAHDWEGLVFMNPPFGGRNGHVPWLRKFLRRANGIAILRAYTSAKWFHESLVPFAETLLFPKGKTKFVRPDGKEGKSPSTGIVLVGMGKQASAALEKSKLGWFVRNKESDAG